MNSLDCRTCGACCIANFADEEGYVHCDAEEVAKLRKHHRRLRIVSDHGPEPNDTTQYNVGTKKTKDGTVCVALKGRIGVQVTCTVYANRPRVCRSFRKRSEECSFARRTAGWP